MARAAVPWMLLLAGCAGEPADSPDAGADWVDGSAQAPALATATSAMEVEAPTTPDPGALDRILSKVPSARPVRTGPDGGTRVGSETGEGGDELPRPGNETSRPRHADVQAGPIEIQPQISSPSLERAAREQIYWQLRACVDAEGKPPPPESIVLAFTIRADGSVDPASVSASAEDKALEPVAECVLREFSSLPFRGPFAARRTSSRVLITWPSVD